MQNYIENDLWLFGLCDQWSCFLNTMFILQLSFL